LSRAGDRRPARPALLAKSTLRSQRAAAGSSTTNSRTLRMVLFALNRT